MVSAGLPLPAGQHDARQRRVDERPADLASKHAQHVTRHPSDGSDNGGLLRVVDASPSDKQMLGRAQVDRAPASPQPAGDGAGLAPALLQLTVGRGAASNRRRVEARAGRKPQSRDVARAAAGHREATGCCFTLHRNPVRVPADLDVKRSSTRS